MFLFFFLIGTEVLMSQNLVRTVMDLANPITKTQQKIAKKHSSPRTTSRSWPLLCYQEPATNLEPALAEVGHCPCTKVLGQQRGSLSHSPSEAAHEV